MVCLRSAYFAETENFLLRLHLEVHKEMEWNGIIIKGMEWNWMEWKVKRNGMEWNLKIVFGCYKIKEWKGKESK